GSIELLGSLRQRAPLDTLEPERAEHLLEQPHVTELFREVVAADLVDEVYGTRQRRRLVPGRRDADPLVTRELVEKRQQQGPAVELARIIPHRDVIPVERLPDRSARANGVRLEPCERLLLLRQVLRVLEDLAIAPSLVEPVALEVLLPLSRRRGRE